MSVMENSQQDALYHSTGDNNTAIGFRALYHNKDSSNNIALGFEAGLNHTHGDNNIAIGNPGVRGEFNTIRIGRAGTQSATYVAGISGTTVPEGVAVIVDSNGQSGAN